MRSHRSIHRLLILTMCMVLSSGVAFGQIVTTDAGAIKGHRGGGLTVYKGVPFAKAPVGDLRWREPQPAEHWVGIRQATEFAPACMQAGVSMPGEDAPRVSEDCLFLNIWTPASRAAEPLPIIVWIYGGAYNNGSASMPLYHGDRLAHKGAIVITVAYRLGALGFLAYPELTRESPHHSSGNYGLMDQIAALEWIQRNASAFGGDPNRVTIAGQSSGSISVSILMASPRARGLFQRAIGESGGLFEPRQLGPNYPLANAEREGEKYAASLGNSSLKELRLRRAADFLGGGAAAVTHPVIEPYVLPETPYEAFVSGRQNDVPLMLGSNAEEARSITNVSSVTASNFATDLERSFGPLPRALIDAYRYSTDEEAREARLGLERDLRFGWDMWAWARLQAGSGKSRAYYYSFQQPPPFPANSVYAGWGASHFAELWYVFDHLDQNPWRWSRADRRLAKVMSGYWVNFARTGDPNGPGLPVWPRFTGTNANVMRFGGSIGVGGVPELTHLQVFDEVYSTIRGKPFPKEQ
jgi:para-nitrobenzyl esterase